MMTEQKPANGGPISKAGRPGPVELLLFLTFFVAGLAKTLFWLVFKDVDYRRRAAQDHKAKAKSTPKKALTRRVREN